MAEEQGGSQRGGGGHGQDQAPGLSGVDVTAPHDANTIDSKDERFFHTPATKQERIDRWMEIAAVFLLAVATVATAWSGYQAARWGGVQATKYAEASATLVESTRASTKAGQQITVDVTLFTNYLAAYAQEQTRLTGFLEKRFRDEFKVAFDAWMATDPVNNPDGPSTPFAMPEYRLAEQDRSDALQAEASAMLREGRDANEQGDRYVLNTVFLASVLFFAALAERFKWTGPRIALLAVGFLMLGYGLFNLVRFPVA